MLYAYAPSIIPNKNSFRNDFIKKQNLFSTLISGEWGDFMYDCDKMQLFVELKEINWNTAFCRFYWTLYTQEKRQQTNQLF